MGLTSILNRYRADAAEKECLSALEAAEALRARSPAFTYDGGHLNELGRQRVAEQLLITLARAGSWR